MKWVFDEHSYIVRLDKGERLHMALGRFLGQTNLQGGWISAIGGAQSVELGFYNLPAKTYQWRTFQQILEIVSLQGTIALDEQGQPMYHLHGVFSDDNYQTLGGHVKDLVVGGTCEIFIQKTQTPLRRIQNKEVGLKTLDV